MLYDQSLLVSGFSLQNPKQFVQRLNNIISLGMGIEEVPDLEEEDTPTTTGSGCGSGSGSGGGSGGLGDSVPADGALPSGNGGSGVVIIMYPS